MLRKSLIPTVSCGAVAAALILAPHAQATGWCPGPGNNWIDCNQCSRELICDPSGTDIWIQGNGVTLDGKGHNLYYGSIYVNGFATTIRNMWVSWPNTIGIFFDNRTNTTETSVVDNVIVWGPSGHGIRNQSTHPVAISNSKVVNGTDVGVYANGPKNTDFRYSTANTNTNYGYYLQPNCGTNTNCATYSTVYKSNFLGSRTGFSAENTTGLVLSYNIFDGNSKGIYLRNVAGNNIYNTAHNSQSGIDCDEAHAAGVSIRAYGNKWDAAWIGSGCSP